MKGKSPIPTNRLTLEQRQAALGVRQRAREFKLATEQRAPSLGWSQPALRTHCIECGCHDMAACFDEVAGEPCSWLAVDRAVGGAVEGGAIWSIPFDQASSFDRFRSIFQSYPQVVDNFGVPPPYSACFRTGGRRRFWTYGLPRRQL